MFQTHLKLVIEVMNDNDYNIAQLKTVGHAGPSVILAQRSGCH